MGYCFKALFVIIVAYVTYCFIQPYGFNPDELKNKRILITGASQNIGEELAAQYSALGARLFITARRESELKRVVDKCKELGASSVDYIVADMSDLAQVGPLVDAAAKILGGLDQVVLNHVVGISNAGKWNNSKYNLDYAHNSAIVNYVSYVHLSAMSIPHLTKSNGNLIVVSSLAGWIPTIYNAVYGATKAALNNFYASLRLEMMLGSHDPYSITLCMMGPIETKRSRWMNYPDRVNIKGHPIDDTAAQIIRGCKCHQDISIDDKYLVALGTGNSCQIFSIKEEKRKSSGATQSAGIKRRKKGKEEKKPEEIEEGNVYKTKLLHEIETSPGEDGSQTSVRLSGDGSLLVAGASDGHLRAWKLPDKTKVFDSKGHKDDITDVDISPDMTQIVSVSRDGKAFLWDASSGHKTMELHVIWNMKMLTRNFRFRNCRFSLAPDSSDKLRLFTTHTPTKRDPTHPCCITKWSKRGEGGRMEPAVVQNTGREAISALAISDDGVYVGIGFMDGSVGIYISFSLQCAKLVRNVHSIFVTSLSFVNDNEMSRVTMGNYDAAIVSVSADCTCQLTKLESRALFSVWLVILLCFIAIGATALYLDYAGLL